VNALLISAICASIHLSVTPVIQTQTIQHIEMSFAPSDRAMLDECFLLMLHIT